MNVVAAEHRRVMRFMKSTWTTLNVRCGGGLYHLDTPKNYRYRAVEIRFTRPEFKAWCFDQAATILSLGRPSLDRIDSTGHYEFGNIQIIELAENLRKDKTVFRDGAGRCFRCRQEKPEDEFVKDKRRSNGRSTICLPCERDRCAERKHREPRRTEPESYVAIVPGRVEK